MSYRFLIFLSIIYACVEPVPSNQEDAKYKKFIEPASTKNQAPLTYSGSCAVLYLADTVKLNKFKKSTTEDEFYTIADDNMYYVSEAKSILESKGIKVHNTTSGKFGFSRADGKKYAIKIADSTWSALYLFDGESPPVELGLTEVEQGYELFITERKR